MKYDRVFRILAFAVILSLLVMATPAIPCYAVTGDETLNVSPAKVEIGDTISVTGSDYTISTTVYIFISSQELDVDDHIGDLDVYDRTTTASDGTGEIDKSIVMPSRLTDGSEDEDVHPGTYYVYTTYSTSATSHIVAKDNFIVRGIELDTSEGPVGTEVEITGSGFDAHEDIELRYASATLAIESGDEATDSKGEFTCTAIIPESTAGDHDLIAEDESNHEGTATFTVEPALTISPTSGKVGDSVTVNGTGFGNKKSVTITFGNTDEATDVTSTKGSFEVDFDVPSVGPGNYNVTAEDTSNNSASAQFRITTNISLSPVTSTTSPGHVGSTITINGTGFKPNYDITITYASEPVTFTTQSLADGSFSYILTVPESEHGAHTITASDGTNSAHATFYMESTSPPIPQPLLPYMDSKASSKAYFDWEDVTDDSLPVTYDLQVATDANFTTLLLDRTGLTTSEYTLTDEEKLESTSKEAPYCWRVRAVDAASNASDWSGAGTFYVGFVFPELEGWVLYTVMGVGGLLLFALGFWLGIWLSRRSKLGGAEAQ
jgi:hypothetical protein